MDFKTLFDSTYVTLRFYPQDIDPVSLRADHLGDLRDILRKYFRGFVELTISDDFLANIIYCDSSTSWVVRFRDGSQFDDISFEAAEERLYRMLPDILVAALLSASALV